MDRIADSLLKLAARWHQLHRLFDAARKKELTIRK